MKTEIKLAIAGVALLGTVAFAYMQFRGEPLPGKGMSCEIRCPKGHVRKTTWEEIWGMGAEARRVDIGPGGGAHVKCLECGEWARVEDLSQKK